MPFIENMQFLRSINRIPSNWKDALKLWRVKKKYPTEELMLFNEEYYYKGVLLQMNEELTKLHGKFYFYYIDHWYKCE